MPIYFHLSNVPLPVSIESIGNDWSQITIQRPQGYPLYHWLQTENGEGEIIIDNKKIRLSAGQGILIRPFIPHSYHPVEQWKTNFVTFDGDLKNNFSDIIGVSPYFLVRERPEFSFKEWVGNIIHHYERGQLDDFSLSTQTYHFLLQLSQKNDPIHQHQLFQIYVEPAIIIMKDHYHNTSMTIEAIAEQLFISPQYLTRLFNRFVDDSPYKYLTNYRISRSKELLVNQSDLAIQEISLRVGFDSPSQFNYLFKQKTGQTPGQFRKLYH